MAARAVGNSKNCLASVVFPAAPSIDVIFCFLLNIYFVYVFGLTEPKLLIWHLLALYNVCRLWNCTGKPNYQQITLFYCLFTQQNKTHLLKCCRKKKYYSGFIGHCDTIFTSDVTLVTTKNKRTSTHQSSCAQVDAIGWFLCTTNTKRIFTFKIQMFIAGFNCTKQPVASVVFWQVLFGAMLAGIVSFVFESFGRYLISWCLVR